MARPERNKLYPLNGQMVTADDMAEMCEVTRHAIYYRLHHMGLTPEEIVKMPYHAKQCLMMGGKRVSAKEVEAKLFVRYDTLWHRARNHGTTIQEEVDREYRGLYGDD